MTEQKQQTLINFKKTQTLLSKIIEMTENNQYCIDIMQQNLAAIGLLRSAHRKLMENHLNTCFKNAVDSSSNRHQKQMIEEILKVTKFYNK